jgi:hypothetical protein
MQALLLQQQHHKQHVAQYDLASVDAAEALLPLSLHHVPTAVSLAESAATADVLG